MLPPAAGLVSVSRRASQGRRLLSLSQTLWTFPQLREEKKKIIKRINKSGFTWKSGSLSLKLVSFPVKSRGITLLRFGLRWLTWWVNTWADLWPDKTSLQMLLKAKVSWNDSWTLCWFLITFWTLFCNSNLLFWKCLNKKKDVIKVHVCYCVQKWICGIVSGSKVRGNEFPD